jgi:predicted lipoprotein with Yx(FWY)xxD motif
MRKLTSIAAVIGSLVFAAPGCGDDDSTSGAPTTEHATSTDERDAGASAATTVKAMKTRYGRILVDGRGRALYLFTREKGATSRCAGRCANAWPVFYARGRFRAGGGADADLLGTTKRRGGRRQVTYNGHPLYYYVTDRKPGQVTCQDVTEFGGTWLVVSPSGAAIR